MSLIIQMKGIIYKIESPNCEECYIGSTKNRLCLRKALHLYQYRQHVKNKKNYNTTAFRIIEKGDPQFSVIETGEFDNITELRKRELEIQCEYKAQNKLININRAYRSDEERLATQRVYAAKQYARDTLALRARMREQYYKNKEARIQHNKKYYQEHKEQIKARMKEAYKNRKICECGIVYTCPTEKHITYRAHEKRMALINGASSKSKSEVGAQEEAVNE